MFKLNIMKKHLLFLIFFCNLITAQKALGEFEYMYTHKVDTASNSKINKILFRTIYDENSTYTYDLLNFKSYQKVVLDISKATKEENPTGLIPINFMVYNFKSKTNFFFANKSIWYQVKEVININWQLTNEEKIFLNYKCQKAIGAFKGRIYEAWFTTEIPLPIAPWKLKGLPGAVLYAIDKTGSVEFTATSINTNSTENIIEIPKNVDTVSKEELSIIDENYINNLSVNLSVKKNGEDFKPSTQKKKKPTNPIELSN